MPPEIGDLYIVTKEIKTKRTPHLDLKQDDVLLCNRTTKWDRSYLFFYVPRLDKEIPYNINVVQMCMKKIG